ncbi:MAG: cryptochrome/photolyase family protein [Planctomycetota bacterium]|jgi:deoxyribodipyrimidine photo-lyase
MTAKNPTILWFRNDLRLDDHDGVHAAATADGSVVPVFIHDPESEGAWRAGGASRWWLDRSLRSLEASLEAIGSRLVVRTGRTCEVLRDLVRETGAARVVASRRHEPFARRQEEAVAAALGSDVAFERLETTLLFSPEAVRTGGGDPYRVFTPFWRSCLKQASIPASKAAPKALKAPRSWPRSEPIEGLALRPAIGWDEGLAETWTPGEAGAKARLATFRRSAIDDYGEGRDRPAIVGTSMLSPHLHFGEISPRRIWNSIGGVDGAGEDAVKFLAEIGWREFAHHVLAAFPETAEAPLRPEFGRFPWRRDEAGLEAWRRGRTGYPLVDAGMRQLWRTGWMHNRVRMVVASFLVKHLLISWTEGARWFWDTLVDADLASNTLGWQWAGGCGADAAPYFRIFNPVLQGEKFDRAGEYVARWVPELAGMPPKFLHRPWEAPPAVLEAAGVRLGETYPRPIVDHAKARARALEALSKVTGRD